MSPGAPVLHGPKREKTGLVDGELENGEAGGVRLKPMKNRQSKCGPSARRRIASPGRRSALTGPGDSIGRAVVLFAIFLWACAARGEHYTLPLLVPAGGPAEPHGVVRILNGTAESATVEVYAIDDSGERSGPAHLHPERVGGG